MSTILNLLNGKGDIIISSCYFIVWRGIHTQWLFKINLYSYFEGKGMLYITGVSKCQKCHFCESAIFDLDK